MILADLMDEYAVVWMVLYITLTALSVFWSVRRYRKKQINGKKLAGKIFSTLLIGFPFLLVWLWYLALSLAY